MWRALNAVKGSAASQGGQTLRANAWRTAARTMSAGERPGSDLRYGWCGLGQMGLAMTANMLEAGLPLTVWNRTPEKCKSIGEKGAAVVASAQQVFESSDCVFVMLSTPEAAREFWSENSKHAGDKMVIDCATLGKEAMVEVGQLVTSAGGKFLEAPVAGHSGMAKAKSIEFMCAGDSEVFSAVGPALDSMAKGKTYFGEEVGAASIMKLVVNATLGHFMAALGEGLVLAQSGGVSQQKYLEIIGNHPMLGNGLFNMFGPKMLQADYAPLFMAKHAAKDLGLAVGMAARAGQQAPLTQASLELYQDACDAGHAEKHMSAVHLALQARRS